MTNSDLIIELQYSLDMFDSYSRHPAPGITKDGYRQAAVVTLKKLIERLEAERTAVTDPDPDSLHGKLDQILKALPVKTADLQRRDVSILILRRAIMGVLDIVSMDDLDDVETGVLAVPGPEADKAAILACVQALKDTAP